MDNTRDNQPAPADVSQSAGVDPKEYFATLKATFFAVSVRIGYLVQTGETVVMPDGMINKKQVTVDTDTWLLPDRYGNPTLVPANEADGLNIVPLGTVRKLALRESEIKPIRAGRAYTTPLGSEKEAPRDGRLIGTLEGGSGGTPPYIEGYDFLSEELFRFFFAEEGSDSAETSGKFILVRSGRPFRAAVLPEDVTFAFEEGDFVAMAGEIAFLNEDDPDGVTVVGVPSFLAEYAPLA